MRVKFSTLRFEQLMRRTKVAPADGALVSSSEALSSSNPPEAGEGFTKEEKGKLALSSLSMDEALEVFERGVWELEEELRRRISPDTSKKLKSLVSKLLSENRKAIFCNSLNKSRTNSVVDNFLLGRQQRIVVITNFPKFWTEEEKRGLISKTANLLKFLAFAGQNGKTVVAEYLDSDSAFQAVLFLNELPVLANHNQSPLSASLIDTHTYVKHSLFEPHEDINAIKANRKSAMMIFKPLLKRYLVYGLPYFPPKIRVAFRVYYLYPLALLLLNLTAIGFAIKRATSSESAGGVVQNTGLAWFLLLMSAVYIVTLFEFTFRSPEDTSIFRIVMLSMKTSDDMAYASKICKRLAAKSLPSTMPIALLAAVGIEASWKSEFSLLERISNIASVLFFFGTGNITLSRSTLMSRLITKQFGQESMDFVLGRTSFKVMRFRYLRIVTVSRLVLLREKNLFQIALLMLVGAASLSGSVLFFSIGYAAAFDRHEVINIALSTFYSSICAWWWYNSISQITLLHKSLADFEKILSRIDRHHVMRQRLNDSQLGEFLADVRSDEFSMNIKVLGQPLNEKFVNNVARLFGYFGGIMVARLIGSLFGRLSG